MHTFVKIQQHNAALWHDKHPTCDTGTKHEIMKSNEMGSRHHPCTIPPYHTQGQSTGRYVDDMWTLNNSSTYT